MEISGYLVDYIPRIMASAMEIPDTEDPKPLQNSRHFVRESCPLDDRLNFSDFDDRPIAVCATVTYDRLGFFMWDL